MRPSGNGPVVSTAGEWSSPTQGWFYLPYVPAVRSVGTLLADPLESHGA